MNTAICNFDLTFSQLSENLFRILSHQQVLTLEKYVSETMYFTFFLISGYVKG